MAKANPAAILDSAAFDEVTFGAVHSLISCKKIFHF
jgi:hypothetical protein